MLQEVKDKLQAYKTLTGNIGLSAEEKMEIRDTIHAALARTVGDDAAYDFWQGTLRG